MSAAPSRGATATDVGGREREEWTEEDEIPVGLYDQPKKYEGFQDDRKQKYQGQAYRYVNNWFLANSRAVNSSRISLPRNQKKFTSHVCLYGNLEPNVNTPFCSRQLKVVIKRLKYWVIDWAPSTRGIWLFTGNWYKLKDPDKERVPLPDGRRVSQEEIHLEMRAVLGLFSNIADMLFEFKAGEGLSLINYLSSFHKNKTPEESHAALSPSEEIREKHPELNSEPFDLNLLRRECRLVRFNLRNLDEGLTIRTKFMHGLYCMEQDLHEAEKRAERWAIGPYDYLASARESEARGHQTTWGDPVPNSQRPRPNMLLELDVPSAFDASFLNNWAREHRLSSAPIAKSSAHSHLLPTVSQQKALKAAEAISSSASPPKRSYLPTSCGSISGKARGGKRVRSAPSSIGKTFHPEDSSSDSDESDDSSASSSRRSSQSVASDSNAPSESRAELSSTATPCAQWPAIADLQDPRDVFALPGIRFPPDEPPAESNSSSPGPPRRAGGKGIRRVGGENFVPSFEAREALDVLSDYATQNETGDEANRALVLAGESLFDDDDAARAAGGKHVSSFEARHALEKLAEYASQNGDERGGVEGALGVLRRTLFPE